MYHTLYTFTKLRRSSVSRSPGGSTGFNSYTGQLAVNVQDGAQWVEGKFSFRKNKLSKHSINYKMSRQMNINEPKAVASAREVTVAVHRLHIRPEVARMVAVVGVAAIMVATVQIWVYRRRLLVYLIRRQVGALP